LKAITCKFHPCSHTSGFKMIKKTRIDQSIFRISKANNSFGKTFFLHDKTKSRSCVYKNSNMLSDFNSYSNKHTVLNYEHRLCYTNYATIQLSYIECRFTPYTLRNSLPKIGVGRVVLCTCHHHQPINVPTAGAQAVLMDYT
jgi:hypothetical protein